MTPKVDVWLLVLALVALQKINGLILMLISRHITIMQITSHCITYSIVTQTYTGITNMYAGVHVRVCVCVGIRVL